MPIRFPTPVFQPPDTPTTTTPSGDTGGATPAAPSTSTPSTASPSSTPAAPTTPETPSSRAQTPESGAGVDFEFMFSEPELNAEPDKGSGLSPSEPVKVATPGEQPAPVQPEKPAVTSEPKPATAPEPATPARTEAPSPAAPPTLDPFDPGALAQHLEANEQAAIQHIADSVFKLSPEDVEALEADVVGTVPKLLARAFVANQKNTLKQLASLVPAMIVRQAKVMAKHDEAEGEFYKAWPDIKKDQHGDLVTRYAVTYRQMHPEVSRKDLIEAVGPMVMMAAKIAPGAPQPQVPGAVVQNPMSANGRPPQPSPFVPAGPVAGGAASVTAPQPNIMETMFGEHDQG